MSKVKKIIIWVIVIIMLLVLIGIGGFYFHKLNQVVTVVTIDINPSLSISLNYKNEVVKVEGLNEDGKKLLKSENFKGDDLEDAIEEIAELVVEKGYITKEDNHILINVEGNITKEEVVSTINREFKEENVECNVIVQDVNNDVKEKAEQYGISENKASYIESILKENKDVTFDELKDKSVSEINKFIEEKEEQKRLEEEKKKQEEEKRKEEEEKKKQEEEKRKEEEKKQQEEANKKEENNNTTSKPSTNKKPTTSKAPASNDRTGAWCEFYKTIPPEGGVEYQTPGFINDSDKYVQASKKYFPEDADWSYYYTTMTRYKTASYCTMGVVEVQNYDKSKEYKVYLDSVTLDLLEPVIVTKLEKAKITETKAKEIVTNWLSKTYKVDIDDCGHQNFYYAINGSTKIPEWQFTCKVDATKKYYAVVVNGRTGALTSGRTWGE